MEKIKNLVYFRLEGDRVPIRGDERGRGARGDEGVLLRQPDGVQLRPVLTGTGHRQGVEVGRLRVSCTFWRDSQTRILIFNNVTICIVRKDTCG